MNVYVWQCNAPIVSTVGRSRFSVQFIISPMLFELKNIISYQRVSWISANTLTLTKRWWWQTWLANSVTGPAKAAVASAIWLDRRKRLQLSCIECHWWAVFEYRDHLSRFKYLKATYNCNRSRKERRKKEMRAAVPRPAMRRWASVLTKILSSKRLPISWSDLLQRREIAYRSMSCYPTPRS